MLEAAYQALLQIREVITSTPPFADVASHKIILSVGILNVGPSRVRVANIRLHPFALFP